MIGRIVSHYKILEKLGEGGMGVVYKAHDTKLDRTVALKFLPPQISATEQDKSRFTQEARAAASLNHPNVCHIYRIEETAAPEGSGRDGETLIFIEMEYIDGTTLRRRIAGAPLSMNDALAIATQVGEALEEAHARGIIHRDIKSDNVMLGPRGQAKVMDFGLAKLKGALRLTRSSSTVGTLAYMAPEQLRGAEADARSDIFSFGVLLYEMLTGRMPFDGAHEAAMMYSITNEPPLPLERYLPDAPSELLHIIHRSLEKDPEDRYQSVHDMVIDIRRMRKDSTRVHRVADQAGGGFQSGETPAQGGPPPPPPGSVRPSGPVPSGPVRSAPVPSRSSVTIPLPAGRRAWWIAAALVAVVALGIYGYRTFFGSTETGARLSVAVADFQNRTNEPELDGLSGMLITAMEQSQRLSIVTRTHMFDILKQMGKQDVPKIDEAVGKEICAKAGIGALVTASIQKFGKLYIIDLKVLDPTRNEYLFTAKEEGEGQESIPSMLDRLSEKTRAALKEKSSEITAGGTELAAVTTTNMEAYQHFFNGEEHINKLEMNEATTELRKAVELDSMFGLAWYRLAYVLEWRSAGEQNDALPRALALIDRLPEKERFMLRAVSEQSKNNMAGGVAILKEMETRYPNDKEMMYNIGDWSYHLGEHSRALEYLKKTLAADPIHERALQHITWTYRDLGQYIAMLESAKRFVGAAGTAESYELLSVAYVNSGRIDEGVKEFEALKAANPGKGLAVQGLATLLMRLGQYEKAEKELLAVLHDSTGRPRRPVGEVLVHLYGLTGQRGKAKQYISGGIAHAEGRKDSTAIAGLMLVEAMIELYVADSPVRAYEVARRSERYTVPATSVDYWFPYSWIRLHAHPEEALPPQMENKPWTPVFTGQLAGLRGDCDAARVSADSMFPQTIPAGRFGIMDELSRCFYRAGRYSEALVALSKGMTVKQMETSFMYPRALATLGRIYEEMGNTKEALRVYGDFLSLWKKADPDLSMLADVKQRAARLKAVSSN